MGKHKNVCQIKKINYHVRLTDIMLGYLLSDQNRTHITIWLILTKEYSTLLKITPVCV